MSIIHSVYMDEQHEKGFYDPRHCNSKIKWDNRLTTFLEHHYGLSNHKCSPLEALYKTHPFLKEMEHSVDVERNVLRVFSKSRPYWFSVEYFITRSNVCQHCGGREYEPTCWAKPCHKCSKDKEILTVNCGGSRFTVVVVEKMSEK